MLLAYNYQFNILKIGYCHCLVVLFTSIHSKSMEMIVSIITMSRSWHLECHGRNATLGIYAGWNVFRLVLVVQLFLKGISL